MLPLHKTLRNVFNYDDVPAGYYYRAMREGSPVQRFWHRKKFESVASRVPDRCELLDFGCSAGSFLAVLNEVKPGVRSIGADIGSRQIEFANDVVAKLSPDGGIRFDVLTDTTGTLPYENARFDVVTCIEVIEHLHPAIAHRFLSEARRVLKHDGHLILTTPNYRSLWPLIEIVLERVSPIKYRQQHISKFTPNSLVKFIESAGFEVQDLSSIFVMAPFCAGGSMSLATSLHGFESKSRILAGALLVAGASPIPESELGF